MLLRYYSPFYEKEKHLEIINLLEEIKWRHGIEYEEVSVCSYPPNWYLKEMKIGEAYVYEYQLKPYSQLILANCEKLRSKGLRLYCETVSSKFKSRSGNVYVAGTIAVVENGVVLLALKYKEEIFEFLRALLKEGWNLLNALEKIEAKSVVQPKEREKEIKRLITSTFAKKFEFVFLNVRQNAPRGNNWDPFIVFSPEADIIAVNETDNQVVGIEVKGYRSSRGVIQKANIYEAIGEAMMYLINPYMRYKGERIEGRVFDEVWLCYPYKRDFEDFEKVMRVTPIGLISAYEGIVKEADENPFVSEKAKEVFLNSLDTFKTYLRDGRKAHKIV